MMDYEAFWRGFVTLFVIIPLAVGAGGGAVWAWRRELSMIQVCLTAMAAGFGLLFVTFAAAVVFFRA